MGGFELNDASVPRGVILILRLLLFDKFNIKFEEGAAGVVIDTLDPFGTQLLHVFEEYSVYVLL